MKTLTAYLAGGVPKGHENDISYLWTLDHQQYLADKVHPISIYFLNPIDRKDDLSDQLSVFGRDMFQVLSSDIILVDLRQKRGVGVGAEMMIAKQRNKVVIGWLPKESHYRKNDTSLLGIPVTGWVHPFVESLTDVICSDLDEVAQAIQDFSENKLSIKNPDIIDQAIRHYLMTQYPKDEPMSNLIKEHPTLEAVWS